MSAGRGNVREEIAAKVSAFLAGGGQIEICPEGSTSVDWAVDTKVRCDARKKAAAAHKRRWGWRKVKP